MKDKIGCFITNNRIISDNDIEEVLKLLSVKEGQVFVQRMGINGVRLELDFFPRINPVKTSNELGFDINIFQKKIGVKKLLIADMDSTIINVECIDELADFTGVKKQVQAITNQSMQGKINFSDSLIKRVKLLKGLSFENLNECFETKVSINPGAETLVKTMNACGTATVLVSGGFTFFAEKIERMVGFERSYANDFIYEQDILTGELQKPILCGKRKLSIMKELAEKLNIDLEDVIAVGDGANDIDIIRNAGLGVSFFGKPKLLVHADMHLAYSDLTALLYFQGIKQESFVYS